LEARYIPVPLKLEPRESINSKLDIRFFTHVAKTPLDQGVFMVQLLDGGELHGVDRSGTTFPYPSSSILSYIVGSGKSDPFVVFTLNGQRVFKSQTKKKTLRPEWNETFDFTVVSVASVYRVYLPADDENLAFSRCGGLPSRGL
jgi:hypothetical protein